CRAGAREIRTCLRWLPSAGCLQETALPHLCPIAARPADEVCKLTCCDSRRAPSVINRHHVLRAHSLFSEERAAGIRCRAARRRKVADGVRFATAQQPPSTGGDPLLPLAGREDAGDVRLLFPANDQAGADREPAPAR